MKKQLSLSITLALLGALALLSSATSAQAQDDPKSQFEREWYAACYPAKDQTPKCLQMSEELLAKYSDSTYAKTAKGLLERFKLNSAWEAFQGALKDYYAGAPDAAKLDKLFSTGDEFLKIQPDYLYVVAQQALAGSSAVLSEVYKDRDKVKSYAERALKVFEPGNTPNKEAMEQAQYAQFRDDIMAYENQYLGYHLIQTNGDQQQALAYLGKSIQVKGKNGGWKDPNNYWLRSTINNKDYDRLSKQYTAMTDEQKNSDAGKEVLKQIGQAVDKLLPDYARVVAVATKPEYKGLQDTAREIFNSLWKFRTDAPDKAADYIKNYAADPTIADVAIPAKPETVMAPPSGPPTAGGKDIKLTGGGGVPGANGKAQPASSKKTAKAPVTRKKKR